MWFLFNILLEYFLYLIVDNLTKFYLINHTQEYRFDALISECLLIGFLIGFISFYHHITYFLIFILFIHIIGTLYTERRFDIIKNVFKILIQIFIQLIRSIFNRFKTRLTSSKVTVTKKLPQQYLYSYHLKPTNDLRLQQTSLVPSLPRPGIYNIHGTTCSLNALLQSLASLNSFYSSLQRNVNLSRYNYDSIVSSFLDLIFQLRNDHYTSNYSHLNTLVDTSGFISRLNLIYPDLLTKYSLTDIAELFQTIIDVLNNALAKQTAVCSTNVIEQVQNRQLTTFSLDYLNKIFLETEAELHNKITIDNLDAKASYIVQYIDLTWLLHHIQLGSIIKNTFSGQILHAYCCTNCSHVRFRTEPFQILPLSINRTNTTIERIVSQLTKIEYIDSISCSNCSSQSNNDYQRESKTLKHGTLFTKIASTLSPLVTTHSQSSDQTSLSTSILPPTTINPSISIRNSSRIKSQTMIANFPNILCIQLKRFSYDRLSQTTIKLTTNISIDPEKILDLSHIHYSTWLGLTNFSTINSHSRYRLIAVCLHLSSTLKPSLTRTNSLHGHYVCLYRTDHSRWFLSDDERITEMNQIDHVFQTSYVTENCYLLFYERYL